MAESVKQVASFVDWHLSGTGYKVAVYDAENQPIAEYWQGNHPLDSVWIGRERKIGSIQLAIWAEDMATQKAKEFGLDATKRVWHDADSEADMQNFFDMTVCVWSDNGAWFWDDAEDHGGFDRVSQMGPHRTEAEAMADAEKAFPNTSIYFEHGIKPLHYPEKEIA